MSEVKMSDENVLYCLQNLAGYDPSDIEDDIVEIAVNDDQFGEMSIVRTAQLGAALIERQADKIKKLSEQIERLNDALTSINKNIAEDKWVIVDTAEDLPMQQEVLCWDGCEFSIDYADMDSDSGTHYMANGTEIEAYKLLKQPRSAQ